MSSTYQVIDGSFTVNPDRSISVGLMKDGNAKTTKYIKGKISDLKDYPKDMSLGEMMSSERDKLEAGEKAVMEFVVI